MRLSTVASYAIVGALTMNFVGCGSSDSTTKDNLHGSNSLQTINGTVSDGPIGNARVFVDKNFNGAWDSNEPFYITNDNNKTRGKFSIDYIGPQGEDVVLIAESYDGNASDPKDHPGVNLNFYMMSVGSNGDYDVNPKKMASYLTSKGLGGKVLADLNVTNLNLSDANQTTIFNQLSKNRNIESIIKKILKNQYQFQLNKTIFKDAKSELNLDSTTDISVVEVNTTNENDVNISEVSNLLPSKATPNVIPVGNGVAITVAKDLTPASENNTSNISYEVSDKNTTDSNQSAVVLKRAIFNLTTSIDDKIHAILSSSFTGGSRTLFITPYNSVIEIPKYHSLVNKGYKPLLAADITVRDANSNKLSLAELSNMQGIIEDERKSEVVDVNTSDLVYLYFDGDKWVDNNSTVDDAWTANDGFANLQLAPYVIAQKKAPFKNVTVIVKNANILKDALIVAKGSAPVTTNASNRILAKTTNTSIPLDYQPLKNNADGNVTFTVPKDLNVTDIVILDKNLKNIGSNAVVSLSVNNSSADVADKVSNIVAGAYKTQIGSTVTGFIQNYFVDTYETYWGIKQLFLPYWAENNATIRDDFFKVVQNCFIDGNCTDINNTMPSRSWTTKDTYTDGETNTTTVSSTYIYTVNTKPNSIVFTEKYTGQNAKDTYNNTYTYNFEPYKITLNEDEYGDKINSTFENIDKNGTIKVSMSGNGSNDGSSDNSSNSNYSETWGGTLLGYFKTSKELNSSDGHLAYDSNLTYEVIGSDEIHYNGDIEAYNGYVKINNQDIANAKGEYHVKNSDGDVSGTYVNDGTVVTITKSSTSLLRALSYDKSSNYIKNMTSEDINVTNITTSCTFNLSQDGGSNTSGSFAWDCAKGKYTTTVNGQTSSTNTTGGESCKLTIPAGNQISSGAQTYNVNTSYSGASGSESCTITYKTSNYGDINIPITVTFQ